MRKDSLVVYNPRAGVLGSVRAIRVRWGQCRVSFSDRSCLELILKSISLGPGSPGNPGESTVGSVSPRPTSTVGASRVGVAVGGGAAGCRSYSDSLSQFDCWTHRHEGRALCPRQTSPASGEVRKESQSLVSVKGSEGKCED